MGGEGGATEDDRVGDGHEFEQTPGDSEGCIEWNELDCDT